MGSIGRDFGKVIILGAVRLCDLTRVGRSELKRTIGIYLKGQHLALTAELAKSTCNRKVD